MSEPKATVINEAHTLDPATINTVHKQYVGNVASHQGDHSPATGIPLTPDEQDYFDNHVKPAIGLPAPQASTNNEKNPNNVRVNSTIDVADADHQHYYDNHVAPAKRVQQINNEIEQLLIERDHLEGVHE